MVKEKIIGNYAFYEKEEYEKALNEEKAILYLRDVSKLEDPLQALKVYQQIISKNLFTTPIGIEFLTEMHEFLKNNDKTQNATIHPVPLYLGNAKPVKDGIVAVDSLKSELRMNRMESDIEFRLRQTKEKYKRLQGTAFYMGCAIAFLITLIVMMFVITTNSNNVNILNYENRLLDKYATWEQELNDREDALREEERQLAIEKEKNEQK